MLILFFILWLVYPNYVYLEICPEVFRDVQTGLPGGWSAARSWLQRGQLVSVRCLSWRAVLSQQTLLTS